MIPFHELTFNNNNTSQDLHKIREASENFFNKFSYFINILGPVLSFTILVFFFILVYVVHTNIIPFWESRINLNYVIFVKIISIFFASSWLFNYSLLFLMKAGCTNDLYKSKFYKNNDPLKLSSDILDLSYVLKTNTNQHLQQITTFISNNSSKKITNKDSSDFLIKVNNSENDLSSNMETRKLVDNENPIEIQENTINNKGLNNTCDNPKSKSQVIPVSDENLIDLPICKYCKIIKPLRSHHCSVCRKCVFKMDHHCPWVNNCIGLYNHRYFMNLLTYQFLYSGLTALLSIQMYLNSSRNNTLQFKFVTVLSVLCFFSTSFLFIVNWFLVFRGNTLIEFLSNISKQNNNNPIKDYSLRNWRDNLFLVFRTRSLLKAVCCCSIKRVPLSGLEWTKLVYANFRLSQVYRNEINDLADIKA